MFFLSVLCFYNMFLDFFLFTVIRYEILYSCTIYIFFYIIKYLTYIFFNDFFSRRTITSTTASVLRRTLTAATVGTRNTQTVTSPDMAVSTKSNTVTMATTGTANTSTGTNHNATRRATVVGTGNTAEGTRCYVTSG